MPELDGYEVLALIREDPTLRHLPVIMISAVEETDSIVRCIELGADDYLPKPFSPVLLRARINAGIARKRLYDLEREYLEQVGHVVDAAGAVRGRDVRARDRSTASPSARTRWATSRGSSSRWPARSPPASTPCRSRCASCASRSTRRGRAPGRRDHRDRLLPRPPAQGRRAEGAMSRVVAFHSFRGGTGKSNTTANVAVLAARRRLRVGVVDTDIQSPGHPHPARDRPVGDDALAQRLPVGPLRDRRGRARRDREPRPDARRPRLPHPVEHRRDRHRPRHARRLRRLAAARGDRRARRATCRWTCCCSTPIPGSTRRRCCRSPSPTRSRSSCAPTSRTTRART